MGRYYNGDIDGKFWVGIQSSDAADRFGVTGCTPNFLEYYFDSGDLEAVNDEIITIKSALGEETIKDLKKFFEINDYYNEETAAGYCNIKPEDIRKVLSEYADLELGIKIRDCIEKNDSCTFDAEC